MAGLTVAEHELIGVQKRLAKAQMDNMLTKREQLAGMALQGLIASNSNRNNSPELLAQEALNYADLLLKASKE